MHQGERRDFPKSDPPSPIYDNDYRHQRLDANAHEIRLLSLKCVENYEKITGFLTNVPFEVAPPYVALSYTWGTPNDRRPIFLADQKFYVNYNLFQALRQLSSGAGRNYIRLWIDAICINQRDTSERNHQVSMMRHIYDRAASVKIWLGIGDNLSTQAFTLARDIAKAVKAFQRFLASRPIRRISSPTPQRILEAHLGHTRSQYGERSRGHVRDRYHNMDGPPYGPKHDCNQSRYMLEASDG